MDRILTPEEIDEVNNEAVRRLKMIRPTSTWEWVQITDRNLCVEQDKKTLKAVGEWLEANLTKDGRVYMYDAHITALKQGKWLNFG